MPFPAAEISRPLLFALAALYAALLLASICVAVHTRAEARSQLRLQVYAWWSILPAVSLSLALHPIGPFFLILGVGIVALRELRVVAKQKSVMHGFCYLSTFAITLLSSQCQPSVADWVFPLWIAGQLWLFLAHRTSGRLAFLLCLSLSYGLSFTLRLGHGSVTPQTFIAWLFFLFAITALNDIGQFVAGTAWGRHRIAPRISPNKTWEGLVGGAIVSTLSAVLFGTYLKLQAVGWLFAIGTLLSLGGFLGDLMFSAAKRHFGVKDFSALIPGHGGMLDRIDSLVVTAPLLHLALMLSH